MTDDTPKGLAEARRRYFGEMLRACEELIDVTDSNDFIARVWPYADLASRIKLLVDAALRWSPNRDSVPAMEQQSVALGMGSNLKCWPVASSVASQLFTCDAKMLHAAIRAARGLNHEAMKR